MRSPHTSDFSAYHALGKVTIIALPAVDADGIRLRGKFDTVFGTTVLARATREPLLDAARRLMSLGFDPDTTVILKHLGSDTECLRSRIGAAAKLTVDESGTPRFKRWKPFSRGAVAPPSEKKCRGLWQEPQSVREGSGRRPMSSMTKGERKDRAEWRKAGLRLSNTAAQAVPHHRRDRARKHPGWRTARWSHSAPARQPTRSPTS
jgi:hypothetical protein